MGCDQFNPVSEGFFSVTGGGSGSGGGDKHYRHYQAIASSIWHVYHNLDKYPSMKVYDNLHRNLEAFIQHQSRNYIIIYFTNLVSGYADFN